MIIGEDVGRADSKHVLRTVVSCARMLIMSEPTSLLSLVNQIDICDQTWRELHQARKKLCCIASEEGKVD